jgi:hypothetical protein
MPEREFRGWANPEFETMPAKVRLASTTSFTADVERMVVHRALMLFIPTSKIVYAAHSKDPEYCMARVSGGRAKGETKPNHRDKRTYAPAISPFVTNANSRLGLENRLQSKG